MVDKSRKETVGPDQDEPETIEEITKRLEALPKRDLHALLLAKIDPSARTAYATVNLVNYQFIQTLDNQAKGRPQGAQANKSRACENKLRIQQQALIIWNKHPKWTLEDIADELVERWSGFRELSSNKKGQLLSRRTVRDYLNGLKKQKST